MQAHHREHLHLEAEFPRVDLRVIALDQAGLFERADPAQTRRGGYAHPARQFDVRHAPVRLQFGEDHPVNRVEFREGHE